MCLNAYTSVETLLSELGIGKEALPPFIIVDREDGSMKEAMAGRSDWAPLVQALEEVMSIKQKSFPGWFTKSYTSSKNITTFILVALASCYIIVARTILVKLIGFVSRLFLLRGSLLYSSPLPQTLTSEVECLGECLYA